MALSTLNTDILYLPQFDASKAIASANLYFGLPDLDPTVSANQIDVYAIQEDGSSVLLAQPVRTSAGGVPTYNGSPVQLATEETEISVKALSSLGSQIYYKPRVLQPNTPANSGVNLTDYAALRAYTGSATKVTITGVLATAQPQGIYGDFSYDSTDTTSLDNGITIIVDALGRRWKRQFSGFVNILWADITIGVDAASKLQSALSIGDCSIPADVVLTISSEVTVPNNVNLRIDGEITGSGRITCLGTSEIFGSGKVICGNIWCISVAAGNPVVTGLYISKSSCYGVYISPTANIGSLRIQNNQIAGCQYGILRNGGTSFTTKNVSITGNVIQNSTGDGIEWNVGPNDKKILIDSNIVTETNGTVANSGIGIGVAGSSYTNNNDLTNYVQQVTITNNHVSGARQGIHTETTAQCKISNNHIENITSAYGDASIAISGILCYAPVDTEISNNQIDNNGSGISVDFGVISSTYTGSPFNTSIVSNKVINSGDITVKAGQHLTMTDENVMIVKDNKVIGGKVTVSGTVNWFIDGNVTRPAAGILGFSFDFNNSSRGAAYQQQYGQVYSITNNYTKDKIGRVNVSVANISGSYFGNISLNANGNNFAIPSSQVVDHEVTRIVYTDVTGFPFGVEYQAGTMVIDKTTPVRYLVTVSGSLNRGTDTYSVFDAANGIVQSTNYAWTTVNNHQLGQAITLSDGTNTKSGYVKQVYINSGSYRMIVCDSSGVALNLGTLGSGTITATNPITYVSI